MDSTTLYKLKNDIRCVLLNEKIINDITDIFSKSNIRVIKCVKKQVNVMKTNKIQAKKDLNENKIIMIMNKISDNNINELVAEYISNLMVDTEEKYNAIMLEIFNKMLKDIKFIKNYIKFAIKIFTIEKKRLNLYPEEFIELIINTINKSEVEQDRSACFEIIKNLVKVQFFNEDIIKFISENVLLTDDNKIIDVYNWFNGMEECNIYADKIDLISQKCSNNNMNRESILISSLIEDKFINHEEIDNKPKNNDDILNTSIFNIIDEYLFLNSIDEVCEFINNECSSINLKNIFCKELLEYFNQSEHDISKGLHLVDLLIKKKVLFKSNASKGLLLFLNNKDDQNEDEDDDQYYEFIIKILKYLKNNNITKNIEHIFKKYKIKLYY
jgi:hypothetical protein